MTARIGLERVARKIDAHTGLLGLWGKALLLHDILSVKILKG